MIQDQLEERARFRRDVKELQYSDEFEDGECSHDQWMLISEVVSLFRREHPDDEDDLISPLWLDGLVIYLDDVRNDRFQPTDLGVDAKGAFAVTIFDDEFTDPDHTTIIVWYPQDGSVGLWEKPRDPKKAEWGCIHTPFRAVARRDQMRQLLALFDIKFEETVK